MRPALLAGCLACALGAPAAFAQTAPPEVRRTVDAFAGHWTLDGADSEPGVPAAPVRGSMDCAVTAGGAAVRCLIVASIGGHRVEAASLIGYSADEHVVRWMEVSSTAGFHDRRGAWAGQELNFETLRLRFPSPGRMDWDVATQQPSGTARLLMTATRRAGPHG